MIAFTGGAAIVGERQAQSEVPVCRPVDSVKISSEKRNNRKEHPLVVRYWFANKILYQREDVLMDEIIRYITENFIKNLENLQLELYREPSNLADFVLKTRKETDEIGRLFIQMMVQGMNDCIREMPERKRNWVVERKGDAKTLTTSLGNIIFFKTLYKSKNELNDEGNALYRFHS